MDSELQELVQAAIDETRRGGLAWKAFNDETFRAPIATGTLHVRREYVPVENETGGYTDTPTYRVEVSDEQGRVVAEESAARGFSGQPFRPIAELFDEARKSALRPDRVIGEMLQALRKRASEAVARPVISR